MVWVGKKFVMLTLKAMWLVMGGMEARIGEKEQHEQCPWPRKDIVFFKN